MHLPPVLCAHAKKRAARARGASIIRRDINEQSRIRVNRRDTFAARQIETSFPLALSAKENREKATSARTLLSGGPNERISILRPEARAQRVHKARRITSFVARQNGYLMPHSHGSLADTYSHSRGDETHIFLRLHAESPFFLIPKLASPREREKHTRCTWSLRIGATGGRV